MDGDEVEVWSAQPRRHERAKEAADIEQRLKDHGDGGPIDIMSCYRPCHALAIYSPRLLSVIVSYSRICRRIGSMVEGHGVSGIYRSYRYAAFSTAWLNDDRVNDLSLAAKDAKAA